MTTLALIIRPTHHGWAVYLTDGREVARFNGPAAKRRALRYLASATNALQTPAVAKKGASPPTGATRQSANAARRRGSAPG
jgi:hypothetical protein